MTIVALVEQDDRLREVLKELLDTRYLVTGMFHPNAYLVNIEKVEAAWRKRDTKKINRTDVIAIGTAINNQMFNELTATFLAGEEPIAKTKTLKWLSEWEKFAAMKFPDFPECSEIAGKLGQYLEFTNRKSQGF
jgi:hypothetical protein